MRCDRMEELLSALVDDELDAREAMVVERHLQGCAACRLEAKRLAAMKDAVRRAAPKRAPDELRDALFAAAGRRRVEKRAPSRAPSVEARWGLVGAWGVAAAAAAAVLMVARPSEQVVPVDFMLAAHDAYALTMPLAPAEELTPALAERLAGAGAAP